MAEMPSNAASQLFRKVPLCYERCDCVQLLGSLARIHVHARHNARQRRNDGCKNHSTYEFQNDGVGPFRHVVRCDISVAHCQAAMLSFVRGKIACQLLAFGNYYFSFE